MFQWWVMDREVDETGISGTGVIGYLLELEDGVIMLWQTREGWHTIEWLPDMGIVDEIHGHNGKTKFHEVEPTSEAAMIGRSLLMRRLPDLFRTLGDVWEARV